MIFFGVDARVEAPVTFVTSLPFNLLVDFLGDALTAAALVLAFLVIGVIIVTIPFTSPHF